MEKKSDLWIVLAVVVGLILGYVLRGTNFKPEDQTAGHPVVNRNIVTFGTDGTCSIINIDGSVSAGRTLGISPNMKCLVSYDPDGRAVINTDGGSPDGHAVISKDGTVKGTQ